jgi:hypothetical protein
VAWRRWRESLLVGGTSCRPISGKRRCSAQWLGRGGFSLGCLMARRGSHLLALSLSGGEVHHQDPLHLRCGLVSWWHTQFNHDSRFLTDELASSWRCLLLGYGLPSKGLRLLSPVMSVTSRRREARFWLQRCRSWRNRHRGLSGQSVLHLWCGCDRSE